MKKRIIFISLLMVCVLLLASLTVVAMEYKQSPMLEEEVQKGNIPPVADRLPDDPFVIGPGTLIAEEDLDWQVGKYGDTMMNVHNQGGLCPQYFFFNREPLVITQGVNPEEIRPNLVKKYTVNDDNTQFTFHLREGLRWSDGEPVDTEDVRFAIEDVLFNEEITPAVPAKFKSPTSREVMDFEIIDDSSFSLVFNEPYGQFIASLALSGWESYQNLIKPKHYLKQFHAKYTPVEEIEPYIEEEGVGSWGELFEVKDKDHFEYNMEKEGIYEFPVLNPWKRVEAPQNVRIWERNPYYHAVDIEGNQLPYIDHLKSFSISDAEMRHMEAFNGNIDIGNIAASKIALYMKQKEQGNFKIVEGTGVGTRNLFLNLTYEDETWREIVRDVRFRKAISLAIDRDEIIKSVWRGTHKKTDYIPTEFKPEEAKELLAEVGLDKKNKDGFRLGPDGEVFTMTLEVTDIRDDFIPTAELLVEYLKDVGINASMKVISNNLQGEKAVSNELKAIVHWASAEYWSTGLWNDYTPTDNWAPLWVNWYNDTEPAEEPPAWVKEIYEIDEKRVKNLPDSEIGKQLTGEVFSWFYENIPFIVITGKPKLHFMYDKDLENTAHSGIMHEFWWPGVTYYFDR